MGFNGELRMEFILKEDRPARPDPPRPLARAHDQARTPQGLHTYNLRVHEARRATEAYAKGRSEFDTMKHVTSCMCKTSCHGTYNIYKLTRPRPHTWRQTRRKPRQLPLE